MVRTIKVSNFQHYVERHFLTFVQSIISESTITRLDLIWDSYPDQLYYIPRMMTRSHPSNSAKLSQFMPSDQIEADSRMFYTFLST